MVHDEFVIYKGKEYSGGYLDENSVVLRSDDPKTLKRGFHLEVFEEQQMSLYIKIVPSSEIREMYTLDSMATYKGYDFYVYEERGDEIYIESQSDMTCGEAKQMGLEMVERGIFGGWIKKDQAKLWIEKRYEDIE